MRSQATVIACSSTLLQPQTLNADSIGLPWTPVNVSLELLFQISSCDILPSSSRRKVVVVYTTNLGYLCTLRANFPNEALPGTARPLAWSEIELGCTTPYGCRLRSKTWTPRSTRA